MWKTPSEEQFKALRKLSLKEFSKRLWKNGGKPIWTVYGLCDN